jgi:hypothetical protein
MRIETSSDHERPQRLQHKHRLVGTLGNNSKMNADLNEETVDVTLNKIKAAGENTNTPAC